MHTQSVDGARNTLQVCSTASNVGEYNMVNLTTAQSPLVVSNIYTSPFNSLVSTSPQLTLSSLISSLAPAVLPLLNTSSQPVPRTSYSPKPATVKSEKPFYIAKLNNRIKKCSGCGLLFRNMTDPVGPPEFILGHLERDWYPAENLLWKLGSYQNKYYHMKVSCILERCSGYQFPEDIEDLQIGSSISTSVKEVLFHDFKLRV